MCIEKLILNPLQKSSFKFFLDECGGQVLRTWKDAALYKVDGANGLCCLQSHRNDLNSLWQTHRIPTTIPAVPWHPIRNNKVSTVFLVFMNSIDLNFNKYVFNLLYGTFSRKLYCNLLSPNCNLSNLLASAEVQMPNVQLATASVFSQKPDVSATPCHHLITLFSLNF